MNSNLQLYTFILVERPNLCVTVLVAFHNQHYEMPLVGIPTMKIMPKITTNPCYSLLVPCPIVLPKHFCDNSQCREFCHVFPPEGWDRDVRVQVHSLS